jgi:hypothetical protein
MAESDIRATMNAIEANASRVIKRVGFEIGNELKRTTPIDTSWARANWLTSIGRPVAAPVGSPESVGTARGAQSAGEARLLVYNVNQGDVWITNNVPYIKKLNEGHSKQAPAGFVEQAIATAIRTIAG